MKITVLGDPICDHNFYRGLRPTPDSTEERGLCETHTEGGSMLLHSLIDKTLGICADQRAAEARKAQGLPPDQSPKCQVSFLPEIKCADLPARCHAFALWEPQPANLQEKDEEKKKLQVWRAAEPPLGYGRQQVVPKTDKDELGKAAPKPEPVPTGNADILVIDDAGLDFRMHALALGRYQWIVLKLTGSIAEGALWDSLAKAQPANLVIILSADQLRRTDLRIDRALSWEATLQDLLRELEQNPTLAKLQIARHLIVTFRSGAALWIPRHDATADAKPATDTRPIFVFDGERAEGEWRTATGPGIVFGYLSCFTTAIVHQLCLAAQIAKPDPTAPPCVPDFESALVAGLTASRALHRVGHGPVQADIIPDPTDTTGKKRINSPEPGFPFAEIAHAILGSAANPEKFATATLPATRPERPDWMLLDEWHVHAEADEHRRPYFDAAFAAAILGPGSLERFPVARFGALRTVDRHEIEGLRIVRQAMQDYREGGKQKKPLNIGVFGPPGAGKSFGVEQIVKAVFGEKATLLTFNLSQFSSPDMLIDAFHQIRDKVVAGETPVAFWDEFDSESYKWLQYLLAPMNDGLFQEGPVTHPIGKCVFIFAGATSPSFDTFGPANPDELDICEPETHPSLAYLKLLRQENRDEEAHAEYKTLAAAWRDFVLKKGPDFKSRLVATLDVLGPNPRQLPVLDHATGQRRPVPDPSDRCWPIRRAFFIRSQFGLKENAPLTIDHGLLHALLEVPRYKSGARSLEFLCKHLRTRAHQDTPRRSHLPGDPLLNRHVNETAFQEICDADTRFYDAAAALAPGLHESYRNHSDPDNPANQPWDKLATTYRNATIQQALRIPRNLTVAELTVEKGSFPPDQQATAQTLIEKHIERLSEAEHNGWMVERMLAGWRYARTRNNDKKLHHLLLPYNQLSEADKEKDRQAVRSYVERLAGAGYRIILPKTP